MAVYSSGKKAKLFIGSKKIKKAYKGNNKIYSAGNIVTYQVDRGVSYTEEVDSDASCLSPSTFTPTVNGWTFVGWREDTTANGDVLTEKVMDDEPIVLYAVFTQNVTVTYYNGSTTKSTSIKKRYYNNGNTVNPSFTLSQASLSGWTARGWSTSATANASITYANATAFTISSNVTLYGLYQRTLTLSYNGNGSTSGSTSSQTDTQYYSSNGTYVNPVFTLEANGFARTNYTFTAWASGSADGMQYTAGASVTLNASRTFYAVWTANSWYVLQNSAWTVDTSGTALDSGWNKESGNDGSWGLYQYGMSNNSGANGSWGSVVIDTKGCKTLRVKLSNCRFENGTSLGIRNRSVSTDRIFTIETTGTHTFTLPDGCEKIQFSTWMPDGHWIYIDEIYLSA